MSAELKADIRKKIAKLETYLRELEDIDGSIELENAKAVVERVKLKPRLPKFATGIRFLDDRMRGGFDAGSFVNVAGENFAGKTELILAVLGNIAKYSPVVFFSFEMYENMLTKRFQKWDDTQLDNLLIDQKHRELDAITFIIRAYAKKGVRFFAIDSRMKIEVPGISEQYERNSRISAELSKLTQELGIVLLLINQIAESDQRTKRLALKGSGDQAYDSDVLLFILKDKDDDSKRIMVCEKDRINGKRWIQDYTMSDLTGPGYEVVEYQERTA